MTARARRPLADRFWEKVARDPDSECWPWTAATDIHGYGLIGVWSEHGRMSNRHASRVSYALNVGPVPDDLDVCHRCDNPPCVNPAHLFLGTRKQNMEDCRRKSRHSHGVRRPDAKLTPEKVREIRALRASGASLAALAADYGVVMQIISRVCLRDIWKHVA